MSLMNWLRNKFRKDKPQPAPKPESRSFLTVVERTPAPTGETVRERRPPAQFSGGTGTVRGRVGLGSSAVPKSAPATKNRNVGYVYNEDTGFQALQVPDWDSSSSSRSSDSDSSRNCSPSPDTGSSDTGSCGGGSPD